MVRTIASTITPIIRTPPIIANIHKLSEAPGISEEAPDTASLPEDDISPIDDAVLSSLSSDEAAEDSPLDEAVEELSFDDVSEEFPFDDVSEELFSDEVSEELSSGEVSDELSSGVTADELFVPLDVVGS